MQSIFHPPPPKVRCTTYRQGTRSLSVWLLATSTDEDGAAEELHRQSVDADQPAERFSCGGVGFGSRLTSGFL